MASSKATSEIRIGTSGWSYAHWKKRFYPDGLPSRRWLAYYQTKFDTVELNASFYRQPRDQTLAHWRENSRSGFLWSVKANRGITHFHPLRRRESLSRFLSAAKKLGDKLGVVLLELPPSLKFEARTVARFLEWLPEEMRFAIEPRHRSWFEPEAVRLLERREIALAMSDSGGCYPTTDQLTADFAYLRFHGPRQLYGYPLGQIRSWAKKVVSWGRESFIYFNNDAQGHAVRNALELKREVARLQRRSAEPSARRMLSSR